MTLFKNLVFKTPVLRVNNRDLNITFYQKTLGLRLVSEENAIAIFSSWGRG
ncbi:C3-degrading proteinase [Streptococcus dysgalactiae]|nr:C3-degrading proteinase [Streptococcus dysgalactiae]